MNANEIFEKHGLHFEDAEHAAVELAELDIVELWDVAEDFQDGDLGISGNEETQATILRAALMQAFTDDRDHITQQDLDLAQEKALSLEDDMEDGETMEVKATAEQDEESEDETPDQNASNTSETDETPAKRTRKRSSESRKIMKSLIEASPDASRNEILEQAFNGDVDISETTAITYFYDIRNELGLSPNGKRGRKPNCKQGAIVEFIQANPELDKDQIIQQIADKFGYKESTAKQYHYLATRELKDNE